MKTHPSDLFRLATKADRELVDIIRRGLPVSYFDQLAVTFNLSKIELARTLGIDPRQVLRRGYSRTKLTSDATERILRGARIHNLAKTVFTEDRAVAEWLSFPAPALGGIPPFDLLDCDAGARLVESLIDGIAHGHAI